MGLRLEGDREVEELLAGIASRLRDVSPALELEAQRIDRAIAASFAGERAPDGRAWAPRKTSTTRIGRRPHARTDRRTPDRLLGDMASSSGAHTDGQTLVIESTHPASAFAQFGTRTEPARQFLPLGTGAMVERLADWIITGELAAEAP